jgi:hypothetical protein
MYNKYRLSSIKNSLRRIDWKLLLFLLLFLNVKLVVKVAAIIVLYIIRPNFRLGDSLKVSRIPVFYLLVIAIAMINILVYQSFHSFSNIIAIVTGIGFWILCLLAFHQASLSVKRSDVPVLHNTLLVFFAINILFSFINIANIIVEIGDINPYRYQGNYQKYFIGTGDFIRGVTFDTSTTNAVINAFAVVYFLTRQKVLWLFLSMAALLLTASNFTNLVLVGTLAVLFIFRSSANQKSLIVLCTGMLVIFLVKVSPQNDKYVSGYVGRFILHEKPVVQTASVIPPLAVREEGPLTEEERMEKVAQLYLDSLSVVEVMDKKVVLADSAPAKLVIPTPSIHSTPFQRRRDTSELQHELLSFAKTNQINLPSSEPEMNSHRYPGKVEAAVETISFFRRNPARIFSGNGIGNFSSKLAFRSTALKVAGGYPAKYRYINDDFRKNHLSLFLSYFTRDIENHSIVNTPNSTYDQISSEYGLLGFSAFLIFYCGFFISHYKKLTYGLPLLLIMGGMFCVEYWFEQLSVVVLFEVLLLLNIREHKIAINANNG